MRWGVCINDARAAGWLARFSRSAAVPSFLVVRRSPADDELWQGISRVEFCDTWEQLLVARDLDAVLVGGADEAAQTAIRQLAQTAVPLYVWPHPAQGLSLAYELTLAAEERSAAIRPLWNHRTDATLVALRNWLAFPGHTVQQIEIERTLDSGDVSDAELDTRLAALQLDDFDLIRWLGGRATRVTGLRFSRPQRGHRRLSVTLEAEQAAGGLWTAEARVGAETAARLILQTASGEIILTQTATAEWRWESEPVDAQPVARFSLYDESVAWNDAVEVFEWADAVHRSLERRRTIELHSEPLSERTIFKTQMTALGCGVLMGTLVLGLAYLAIAATIPLPGWLLNVLRTLIFAPLFLFLLAQLLLPLSRPARPSP